MLIKRKFLLLLPLLFITVGAMNPLRWPKPVLEVYVQEITPLESSFEKVMREIESHKWMIDYSSKTQGFYDQRTSPNKIVGDMSIRANLGDYQSVPFKANVTVFWGFDKSGKLIDIWIWRTYEGL